MYTIIVNIKRFNHIYCVHKHYLTIRASYTLLCRTMDLNWILGLSVSIISIAVTVILGIQVYTLLTIDKRVQKTIQEEREKYKEDNAQLAEKLKKFTIAVQRFTSGNIYISNEEYCDAFCVFCLAAIDANKLGEAELTSSSLEQAIRLFDYNKNFNKSDIGMKYADKIKEEMIGISDKKAIAVYNFLSDIQRGEK